MNSYLQNAKNRYPTLGELNFCFYVSCIYVKKMSVNHGIFLLIPHLLTVAFIAQLSKSTLEFIFSFKINV